MHQRIDQMALASLFILGAIIGAAYIITTRNTFFYQQFSPELVMWACGRGFLYVVDRPQALLDFLHGQQSGFDCQVLDLVHQTQAAGLFARKQLYLSAMVSLLWRLFGVRYAALWPLFAVLHGAYAAGCFALTRLFFNRCLAVVLAVFLALSPTVIGMLFALRDYSKAPFIIWGIVLLLLALRSSSPRQAITRGALAGLVAGLGTGFRSDSLILVPIGIFTLLIGGDLAMRSWRTRGLTVAAFVAVLAVVVSPVMGIGNDGGFGTLVMQGATDPFDRLLGVRQGPYSLGWKYSDELTLSTVAADLRPDDPSWDAKEARSATGVSQSMTRSTHYLLLWAPLFAADFATRALKGAGWLAGYAALVAPDHRVLDPGGAPVPTLWFGRLFEPVYQLFGRAGLPWLGGLGLVCLLLRVFSRSRRECAALALLLVILLTYPVIQFSIRHVFHLEIWSWIGLLSLAAMPLGWRETRGAVAGFAPWLVGSAVVVAAVYAALIQYQDRILPARVADLLQGPRELIATQPTPSPDGHVLLPIPLPDRYRALVAGPIDSMQVALPDVGNPSDVRAAADRLLITIGGPLCPPGRFPLGFHYRKRPEIWQPFDHDTAVTVPADTTQRTMVIEDAFYRPTQYLDALVLSPDRSACVAKIERILARTPLPLAFSAVLTANWPDAAWHLGFGSFSVSPK